MADFEALIGGILVTTLKSFETFFHFNFWCCVMTIEQFFLSLVDDLGDEDHPVFAGYTAFGPEDYRLECCLEDSKLSDFCFLLS